MKEFVRQLLDAGLCFMISFLSAVMALDEITIKAVIIALCASGVIGLIKLRDYNNTKLNPKTPVKTIFI